MIFPPYCSGYFFSCLSIPGYARIAFLSSMCKRQGLRLGQGQWCVSKSALWLGELRASQSLDHRANGSALSCRAPPAACPAGLPSALNLTPITDDPATCFLPLALT